MHLTVRRKVALIDNIGRLFVTEPSATPRRYSLRARRSTAYPSPLAPPPRRGFFIMRTFRRFLSARVLSDSAAPGAPPPGFPPQSRPAPTAGVFFPPPRYPPPPPGGARGPGVFPRPRPAPPRSAP